MSADAGLSVALRGRLGAFDLDATFAGPHRGVTALFGPSGCGKTTVLRGLAGLQRLEGTCVVGGETWQDGPLFRPPYRRAVGYVFQEASLFAHLSVRRNLLYGAPAGDAGALADVVAMLGLAVLLDRSPRNLSGGERQRVAIGRALLSRPKLLLMDEPLSALDRATKEAILPFLERLFASLSVPVVYVSHDMAEVERLAGHLVLMRAGRVVAAGPLATLQSDPALPLAGARDAAISLDGVVEAYDAADGLARLGVAGGTLLVPAPAMAVGERRRVRIAAGDVSLARDRPGRTSIVNILPARILDLVPSGHHEITVVLSLGADAAGARLLSRVTRRSAVLLELGVGADVYAQVKGVALVPRGG